MDGSKINHMVKRLTFVFLVVCYLKACSPVDHVFSRGVGYRADKVGIVEVRERVRCLGKTLYITPEGKNTSVKFFRLKFTLIKHGQEVDLSFLDPMFAHICYPLGRHGSWLAIRSNGARYSSLEYNTTIHEIDQLIVFSEEFGIIKSFHGSLSSFLFFRDTEEIWVREHNDSVSIVSVCGWRAETRVASPMELEIFNNLISSGLNFYDSLFFSSPEQMNNFNLDFGIPRASHLVAADGPNFVFIDPAIDINSWEIKVLTDAGKIPCASEIMGEIGLESTAKIVDNFLWYYKSQRVHYWETNRVTSLDLSSCLP